MDFALDEEQAALRDAVRSLLKGYDPQVDAERRRQVSAADPGFDEELWGRLAEMGVLGLPFAEADGGMGAGPVEVALVAEEFGRVLAPEPFVAAVVHAGGLVAALGSPEQRAELLGALAEGRKVLAVAPEPVDGVAEPVPNGARADTVVVPVADGWGLVPGGGTAYRTLDGGRASAVPVGDPIALGSDPDAAARAQAAAQIAYCHEAVGAMSTAMDMTTAYLTTRKQFGVTLNRFQALTFRAADMYTSLELARSIAAWATMVLADPESTTAQVVEAGARAKLQISKAARHIGQEAIQLHGGIGMTAEYAVGHYVARLTVIDQLLGDAAAQVRELSRSVGAHTTVEPIP